jgi:hypothetical protein
MFLLSRWSGGLVKRYGPKLPLVIGPVIAALGFALFMRPWIGGSYWTTFFPAVTMLGFGMATSVAPLTTTVMNAVSENSAGIASGVNNAVARTAGVLAIAALGLVMLYTFNHSLDQRLSNLEITAEVQRSLHGQSDKLAGAEIPDNFDPEKRIMLKKAIGQSFVSGFRRVMMIAVALALLSALVAWLLIQGKGMAKA